MNVYSCIESLLFLNGYFFFLDLEEHLPKGYGVFEILLSLSLADNYLITLLKCESRIEYC